MKFLIKIHPEINVKSPAVKRRMVALLKKNMEEGMRNIAENVSVISEWDRLFVDTRSEDSDLNTKITHKLQQIPGIQYLITGEEYIFSDKNEIAERVVDLYKDKLPGKTFCVRVKRFGTHSFTSIEMERFLGAELLKNVPNIKVNLHTPEVMVALEIKNATVFLVTQQIEGVGGFPVGAQGRVLSLISGGYDSTVSSFLLIKKGCCVDFLFFNLGGQAHERGVKEVSVYIAQNFSNGYKANIITVNFEEVVKELIQKIHPRYRGIVLKRMMMRTADTICKENRYLSIVTGESLGQVSSQTLQNLSVITEVLDTMIFRPLLGMDKNEIIDISRKIGTEVFAKHMPEYCGVVSEKPSTGAKLSDILFEEEKFDMSLLEEEYLMRKVERISDLSEQSINAVEVVTLLAPNVCIIDIRETDQIKKSPLCYPEVEILHIPFFNLLAKSSEFKKSQAYVLYCDKGILSHIHAQELKELGFDVKVFRPESEKCVF